MHRSGLTELEAVLAVARLGNFRAAATELGMSPSALSQAIAGIEARLNVRLFHRTTRSVALTEAGEQFVGKIAPALSTIRDAIDAVNSHRQTPSGTLRINMAASAAHLILRPVVLEYLRRYPEMKVDMVTEGRLIDIVAGGYDAGVRFAETVPGVVGGLHDPDAQRVVGIEQVHVGLDRVAALEVQDDGQVAGLMGGLDLGRGPGDPERQRRFALQRQPVGEGAQRVPGVLDRGDRGQHGGHLAGPEVGQVPGQVPGLDQRAGGVEVTARDG